MNQAARDFKFNATLKPRLDVEIKDWHLAQPNKKTSTVPAVKPATFDNSWDGIYNCAKKAGAKFPECVAAQWALESAWGKHTSGQNNYFGIKGKGTIKTTWEDYGNGPVVIKDEFKDFATPMDCIVDLVDKWYKDYRTYKGVNRALTAEQCATLLRVEGYATDPNYSSKLISIMRRQLELE